MLLSKCVVCDNKNWNLSKDRKLVGLLSSSGIETPLREIPLVGPVLF